MNVPCLYVAGMVATVENYGPDALEDWEVDELLDWTTSLNFDEYVGTVDWFSISFNGNIYFDLKILYKYDKCTIHFFYE